MRLLLPGNMAFAGTVLFTLVFSVVAGLPSATADNGDGDFVEYSLSYSGLKSEGSIQGSGSVKLEVVQNFGNGTVRLGFSGSINRIDFQIEKNTDETTFFFPYVMDLPEFTSSTSSDNGDFTIVVERMDDRRIVFQESDWILNVSAITYEAILTRNGESYQISADGELAIFSSSGLLYSFDGHIVGESTNTTGGEFSIRLIDTNLALDAGPEKGLSFISQARRLAYMGIGGSMLDSQLLPSEAASVSYERSETIPTSSYVLIGGLTAMISLVSILSVRSLRHRKKGEVSEEESLHWVH